MSFPNGSGYTPTGVSFNHGASPDERSPKRQKMSPPAVPAFKTPQAPVQRKPPCAQPPKDGERQERTDINDLGDLLVSSGIDEKREEEFLSSSYHRNRQQLQGSDVRQQANLYSNQQILHQQQPNTFDLLSQNFSSIGQRPGNLGAPVKTQADVTRELEQKHRDAVREHNVRQQQHLHDPFLYGSNMRDRMQRVANEFNIKIPMTGLFDRISNNNIENKESMELKHKSDGGGSIQLEKAPSILQPGAPLEAVLCLLSLATRERIYGLTEDAYALARGRQIGSDGIVPDHLANLAVPAESHNHQQAQVNGNTPTTSRSQPSIHPPTDTIAEALAKVTRAERRAEELRLKKRADRRKHREAAAANAMTSTANGEALSPANGIGAPPSANGGTPALSGSVAPEPPKLTKKERERLAKQDVSEEVQMKQANTALSMALGGGKKKYSWLSGDKGGSSASSPGMGTSRSATPGVGGGTAKGSAAQASSDTLGTDGLPPEKFDRKYGVWREDGPNGKDVQMRDWVNVLDWDGKAKKTLTSAVIKLGRERLLDGE